MQVQEKSFNILPVNAKQIFVCAEEEFVQFCSGAVQFSGNRRRLDSGSEIQARCEYGKSGPVARSEIEKARSEVQVLEQSGTN